MSVKRARLIDIPKTKIYTLLFFKTMQPCIFSRFERLMRSSRGQGERGITLEKHKMRNRGGTGDTGSERGSGNLVKRNARAFELVQCSDYDDDELSGGAEQPASRARFSGRYAF